MADPVSVADHFQLRSDRNLFFLKSFCWKNAEKIYDNSSILLLPQTNIYPHSQSDTNLSRIKKKKKSSTLKYNSQPNAFLESDPVKDKFIRSTVLFKNKNKTFDLEIINVS